MAGHDHSGAKNNNKRKKKRPTTNTNTTNNSTTTNSTNSKPQSSDPPSSPKITPNAPSDPQLEESDPPPSEPSTAVKPKDSPHEPNLESDPKSTPKPSTIPSLDSKDHNDHDGQAQLDSDAQSQIDTLTQQLEALQTSHAEEVEILKAEAQEAQAGREVAEEQYQTLRGRVEKIKETLSERLHRDREELEEMKERAEKLETRNAELEAEAEEATQQAKSLEEELDTANRELSTLRSQNNRYTLDWKREKDDLLRVHQRLKDELHAANQASGEWEVIAMEERSVRKSVSNRVQELEEQFTALTETHDALVTERIEQTRTIERLQSALQELQETRKKELRELVDSSEEQARTLKQQLSDAQTQASEAEKVKEALGKELERMLPFEKEIKEKNLLIGKLRHEAIVLNEHLTKALRLLKKAKPEDNVDRYIVTNHLLQFLSLDRSDPKRFQILQVLAGYLNWTDPEREQAGLARPGGTSSTGNHNSASAGPSGGAPSLVQSLRIPLPFGRSTSSASLHNEYVDTAPTTNANNLPRSASPLDAATPPNRESFSDLLAGLMERGTTSLDEGGRSSTSRTGSMSSMSTNQDKS